MKLMIDLSNIKECWNNKKVLLTGIATGRAGNLRGLDVLSNMCHYMKMNVFYNKIPLSSVHMELDGDVLTNEQTTQLIQQQIKDYVAY